MNNNLLLAGIAVGVVYFATKTKTSPPPASTSYLPSGGGAASYAPQTAANGGNIFTTTANVLNTANGAFQAATGFWETVKGAFPVRTEASSVQPSVTASVTPSFAPSVQSIDPAAWAPEPVTHFISPPYYGGDQTENAEFQLVN